MLKNRINQKKSEKIRKFPENVANFFEKSLVRCLDFPKISTSLKIVAYKPLLIKKTKCIKYYSVLTMLVGQCKIIMNLDF